MSKRKTPETLAGAAVAVLTSLATPALASGAMLGGTDWTAPLDHYCERVGPGFWAEPFNTFSNAAFLIAAAVILYRQRRSGWTDRPLITLALLGGSVGVGSFLFHTLANQWTLIADMLPIAVFIYAFFLLAMRRFLQLGAVAAGVATATLLLLSPGIQALLQPILGGSAAYAPGLITTFGVAVAVPAFGRGPAPRLLVAAGFALAVALAFRVLDQPVCGTWPAGTHFLWHTFNGLAVGLALLAAERVGPVKAVVRPAFGWRMHAGSPASRAS